MASAFANRTVGMDDTWTKMHSIITVDELARAMRVDRKTIYEMVHRGEIPGVVYVGRNIRFVRDVVLEWLCSGTPVSRSSRRTG